MIIYFQFNCALWDCKLISYAIYVYFLPKLVYFSSAIIVILSSALYAYKQLFMCVTSQLCRHGKDKVSECQSVFVNLNMYNVF